MGNHEIQARIDIQQHSEWDEYKKNCNLALSIITDAAVKDIDDIINNNELKSYIAKECNISLFIDDKNILLIPIVNLPPPITFYSKEN